MGEHLYSATSINNLLLGAMANQTNFRAYQQEMVERFEQLLASHPHGIFDENGLPAYTNPNPLMRWIFWQRVKAVMHVMNQRAPYGVCLDFGCGLGVLLPFLRSLAENVIALDLDTKLVEQIGKMQRWENVQFAQNLDNISNYHGKVDVIVAMDVLEHVDDLETILDHFQRLLSPQDFILVTGPTENNLYRLGRALAKYSGHYHLRSIYDINVVLQTRFQLKVIKSLYPFAPLFLVSLATNKGRQ